MSHQTANLNGSVEFDVSFVAEGVATGLMPIQDGIRNPFGTVHAGAMIWFADVVATTLALQGEHTTPGMKGFPLAITLNANILSNSREGALQAKAVFVKKGRTVSTVRTTVSSDDGKTLLDLTTTHIAS